MTNVKIAPEVYKQVEQMAEDRRLSADAVLAEAVQHYFRQMQREKIAVETRFYREQHAKLKETYLGQFIAMRDEQVIDTDAEFQPLHKRIRDRFGRLAVLITMVEEEPAHELVFHSFRLESTLP